MPQLDLERTKTHDIILEILHKPKSLLDAPNLMLTNAEIKFIQIGMVPRPVLLRALKRRNRRATDAVINTSLRFLDQSCVLQITSERGLELYSWKGEVEPSTAEQERERHDEWQMLVLAATVGILRRRAQYEPMQATMLDHLADSIEKYRAQVVSRGMK